MNIVCYLVLCRVQRGVSYVEVVEIYFYLHTFVESHLPVTGKPVDECFLAKGRNKQSHPPEADKGVGVYIKKGKIVYVA